jgi:SAM-dependent methyltransferase
MTHAAQINFVEKVKKENLSFFENKKVIEIGSLDINGTVRTFFTNCEYVGVDVGEGPNVDLVCPGQEVDHTENTYDVSCSVNCFEHNPYWIETFRNMHRMTRVDGLIFVSVPTTGCPEHGTHGHKPEDSPLTIKYGWNYYKNLTEKDYRDNFNLDEMFSSYKFEEYRDDPSTTYDIYFYGFKK